MKIVSVDTLVVDFYRTNLVIVGVHTDEGVAEECVSQPLQTQPRPPGLRSGVRILVRRLASPVTRTYVQRRAAEGLTKREIILSFKRHIAREIHKIRTSDKNTKPKSSSRRLTRHRRIHQPSTPDHGRGARSTSVMRPGDQSGVVPGSRASCRWRGSVTKWVADPTTVPNRLRDRGVKTRDAQGRER
jgi:hypothetical protein